MTNEEFWKRCLEFDCRHCGQKKGDPCRDVKLRKAKPHSARQEAVRLAIFMWKQEKTRTCPTCHGKGRVAVIGKDARFFADGNPARLIPLDSTEGKA